MESGISTFFICTRSTFTPQGSVTRSIEAARAVAITSCDFKTSSSECCPMILRSAVAATCTTLSSASLTLMIESLGLTVRRQITALIFTGTLSRVIVSCCSTIVVRTRKSVIARHSRKGMVK